MNHLQLEVLGNILLETWQLLKVWVPTSTT